MSVILAHFVPAETAQTDKCIALNAAEETFRMLSKKQTQTPESADLTLIYQLQGGAGGEIEG